MNRKNITRKIVYTVLETVISELIKLAINCVKRKSKRA